MGSGRNCGTGVDCEMQPPVTLTRRRYEQGDGNGRVEDAVEVDSIHFSLRY